MKIAVVCDWFLRTAAEQATRLALCGHEVLLVCRDHAFEFAREDEREQLFANAQAAGVSISVMRGTAKSFAGWLSAMTVANQVRVWKPDILHFHENHEARFIALRGGSCLVTVHDPVRHPGDPDLSRLNRMLTELQRRRAKTVIVHSERLAREYAADRPEERVRWIPLGFAPANHVANLPERQNILFFGRIREYKGLDVLLEAMATIWQCKPLTRLTIAGEGELPKRSAIMGDRRVSVYNMFVTDKAMEKLYDDATIVCLPYMQASQSGVAMLALSKGIPLVVTATGGLPEVVKDGRYVVPPGRPDLLSMAILRALEHSRSDRQALLAWAGSIHGWPRVITMLIKHYHEARGDAV